MDRRTEIILATLELASDNGLGTVSMNQIAEKIGISKPALYKHFSSREEIITALYSFLRDNAKKALSMGEMSFEFLDRNISLEKLLNQMVDSYRKLCTNPDMFRFYKIIMSQRAIDTAATEIMIMETRAMIDATKKLFYALQVKQIADFSDPDAAAVSFAMSIHSIIDFECDLKQIESEQKSTNKNTEKNMMKTIIKEF